jgi:hypothetical protein
MVVVATLGVGVPAAGIEILGLGLVPIQSCVHVEAVDGDADLSSVPVRLGDLLSATGDGIIV